MNAKMDQIRNRLDHYQPDDKIKAFCRKYIFFVTFYTFFVLILLIYTFFSTNLSIYGWLLFTNFYFCVFPIFCFIGNNLSPLFFPFQRFYNWMLLVSSIISFYILFEGIFTYSAKDLSLMMTYGVLTWVNTAFCWKATQSIFDGVRTNDSLLDNLNPKGNGKKGNNNNKKWGLKKKFFGKGKTTKDSHYVEV